MRGWLFWTGLAACAFIGGCTKIGSPASEGAKADRPQQEYYGATVTFYQDDRLNAILQAGRIRKFEKQSIILLDSGVVMDFYSAEGRHTTTLWADSARTDEYRKDMIAQGHVVAKSDSGETLESSELRWENRTRQIRSDRRVKLSTPTDTIYGIGFVSDEHLRNWRIEQPTGKTFRELEKRVPRDTLTADTAAPETR
jgi:LPS export ABC transporter protein LptC